MSKYRVAFEHKQIKSIHETDSDSPSGEIPEDRTGAIIYAIIEASSKKEATEKANRLEQELQTGKTKKDITKRGR